MSIEHNWREYERQKRIIAQTSESSAEYETRIKKLVEALGL